MLSQLRSGASKCFLNSGVNVLSTLIPAAAISGVGFAFKDYPAVWNALDGKLGANLRGQITKGGIVVLDKIWDNGFRDDHEQRKTHHGNRTICAGMKIRVPVSALWLSLFKSLGAAPTGMNFAEVYAALQTKVVDGQENPPAIIAAAKLNEVQKYASVTNHMWDGWWFLINRRAWSQVPPNSAGDGLQESSTTPASPERADVRAAEHQPAARTSPQPGMTFNDVDPAAFPQQALGGWILQGMAREVRRRGVGPARGIGRQAGLNVRMQCMGPGSRLARADPQ